MNCPTCGQAMTALLVSYVCDRCTSERPTPASRGFAVVHVGNVLPTPQTYLFLTRADAERWVELNGAVMRVIEVGAHHAIEWLRPAGANRGIILADRLYDVVADPSLASTTSHAWPLE